jgi:hypothetical protein
VFCCSSQLPNYIEETVNIFNITTVELIESFRKSNSDSVYTKLTLNTYHSYGAKTDTMDTMWTYETEIFYVLIILNIYEIFTADFCTKDTHNGTQNPIFQTL